jgi:hypothetical protein
VSRRQISDRKFLDYRDRDARGGVELTPARLRFLRALADDFADEMEQDAAMERMDGREEEPEDD